MQWGRIVSSGAASVAVAGCVLVVVGISRADRTPAAEPTPTHTPTPTSRPATPVDTDGVTLEPGPQPTIRIAAPAVRGSSGSATTTTLRPPATTVAPPPTTVSTPPHTSSHTTTPAAVRPTTHAAPRRSTPTHPSTHATTHTPTYQPAAAPVRGGSLPLGYYTGSATRVITVVARSHASTTATLQAWNKAPGGGWLRYGAAVTAHVGSDGLSTAASEYRSATPIGSFSLTQAFGHYSNPGTGLPYTHTNSHYWWISDTHSSLYNTMQYCHPGCSFAHSPNEHLYYETPYYNYAVVINYNRYPKPVPGRGSAFFFHVTDGAATAGCVAISQTKLVSLMRWLTPSAHPRMLIGVS